MCGSGHPAARAAGALRARAAVTRRFQILLSRTAFTQADVKTYTAHWNGVTQRLKASFASNRQLLIGSAARGSAIRQSSDLDLMVVLRKAEAQWGGRLISSETVLNRVADALRARFWNTGLGRDGQAVVVDFGDGQYPVDVVPAIFDRVENKIPIYLIPDGCGGWMETSPAVHNRFIALADQASAGKLKNVAKLVKYWRWCRTPELPLSSFHVEMLLATERICASVKSYAQCLFELFHLLSKRECRTLRDPLKISGFIYAANTEAKRERLNAAVRTSTVHAAKAVLAEQGGGGMDAVQQWDIVFNGRFPVA